MISPKLQPGDEIRVIAPSRSLSIISDQTRNNAIERFKEMGLKVSYSKHAEEKDDFNSSSIQSRVEDIHDAFRDQNIKGILTAIGGFNVNQILGYLDYDLIKNNPKIICGYSDITALANAIYSQTGLITYSGPHFFSFGMQKGLDYTIDYFKKCLMSEKPFEIFCSSEWSDDRWFEKQEDRTFISNEGYFLINEGKAEGKIIGGNLCTLNLLQGTELFPDLSGAILFLEDDYEVRDVTFDRDLQSLIHQPGFSKVKGLVIGRFQKASQMTKEKLLKIITTKKELNNIPILAEADFGHTTPQITFPIGGIGELIARGKELSIKILKH